MLTTINKANVTLLNNYRKKYLILINMLNFIKYNLIGILNTLITICSVYIMHQLLNWNLELSNFLGFIFGGTNSYICNRIWNFKSNNRKRAEIMRFITIFISAYLLNLVTLELCMWLFTNVKLTTDFALLFKSFASFGFLANIVANIVYVVVSFSLYKKWVFKKQP